jgi:pimeloyl-ACP methyl ester carboxylesterase
MLSHSELAVLAGRSYSGPQSGHVALDVRYDLIPREGEVVVVMPGTHPADALDWLRDLRVFPSFVPPLGPVHSGFGEGAAALWPKLERDLPPYGLITYAGHSLGGALAQGCAAIHARRWPDVTFRVVTFGAPRVSFLNPWFGLLARSGTQAVEYQRAGDIVPDKAVAARFANLPDDEALADDDLAFLASAGVPAAGEVKLAVDFLEILVPWLVANNLAHPINNPVIEAQTKPSSETHGFNEGR